MAGSQDHLTGSARMVGAFAAAVVALGYGITLPLLPTMISELMPAASPTEIAWHTSLLAGAFAIGPLVAAGPWGLLSDRYGRQPILIVGMLGFALTFGVSVIPTTLWAFYALRLLNGGFAAAIVPSVLALVTDFERDEPRRARSFALISAASSLGLLAGPMIGGLAADLPGLSPNLGGLQSWRIVTFVGVAVLSLAAAGAIASVGPNRKSQIRAAPGQTQGDRLSPAARTALVLLAALVAAGLGLFEVGLTLRSRSLDLSPSVLGFMFAGCMVIMLLVQALGFSPLARPAMTKWFISPAFLVLGLGLVLILRSPNGSGLTFATAGAAAAGGFLAPALAYWLSLGSGRQAGARLGLQSAAVSAGQTLGSALAAAMIGNVTAGVAWLAALTISAAAAGLALGVYLDRPAWRPSPMPLRAFRRRQG